MTEERLQLATWNIHMGLGTDGRRDLGRTAEVIRQIKPDLIGLQEVDNRQIGTRTDLDQLSTATGLASVSGPTMQNSTGDYGNALLTRLPVREVERFDISVDRREPRGLLICQLDWCGEPLQVAVTHLGLRSTERRMQVRRLIGHLTSRDREPLLLLGDFNEWLVWGRPRRWLQRHFGQISSPPTFPARWPLFGLDHILADPPQRLGPKTAWKSRLARQASDHLPLLATYSRVARQSP